MSNRPQPPEVDPLVEMQYAETLRTLRMLKKFEANEWTAEELELLEPPPPEVPSTTPVVSLTDAFKRSRCKSLLMGGGLDVLMKLKFQTQTKPKKKELILP